VPSAVKTSPCARPRAAVGGRRLLRVQQPLIHPERAVDTTWRDPGWRPWCAVGPGQTVGHQHRVEQRHVPRRRSSGRHAAADRRAGRRRPGARPLFREVAQRRVPVRPPGTAGRPNAGPIGFCPRNSGGSSRPKNRASRSDDGSIESGGGTSGIGFACSGPASAWWNEADSVKIARPCWTAVTRRVLKEWPSRNPVHCVDQRHRPGRRAG